MTDRVLSVGIGTFLIFAFAILWIILAILGKILRQAVCVRPALCPAPAMPRAGRLACPITRQSLHCTNRWPAGCTSWAAS